MSYDEKLYDFAPDAPKLKRPAQLEIAGPAHEWGEASDPKGEPPMREIVAKALWDGEIAEERRLGNEKDWAPWPEDAHRQPYCQSTYRLADFVLRVLTDSDSQPGQTEIREHTPDTGGAKVKQRNKELEAAIRWIRKELSAEPEPQRCMNMPSPRESVRSAREQFEEWWKSQDYSMSEFYKDGMWLAWQAALESSDAQAREKHERG